MLWWTAVHHMVAENARKVVSNEDLRVFNIPRAFLMLLTAISERTLTLQFTIQEEQIFITNGNGAIEIEVEVLKCSFKHQER